MIRVFWRRDNLCLHELDLLADSEDEPEYTRRYNSSIRCCLPQPQGNTHSITRVCVFVLPTRIYLCVCVCVKV